MKGNLQVKEQMKQLVIYIITLNLKMLSNVKILICIVTTVVGRKKKQCRHSISVSENIAWLNSNIELSFMLPYHTKFGPDWCFGLIKMKYKHSYVSSISQLAEVVLTSTIKSINIPQLISEPCSDNSLAPVRTWKMFLEA